MQEARRAAIIIMKSSSVLTLILALAISPSWVYAASILKKCTDGKQITYTDKPCEKLGLKDAGPIKDTVTIVPHYTEPKIPKNKSHEVDSKESTEEPGKQLPDKSPN